MMRKKQRGLQEGRRGKTEGPSPVFFPVRHLFLPAENACKKQANLNATFWSASKHCDTDAGNKGTAVWKPLLQWILLLGLGSEGREDGMNPWCWTASWCSGWGAKFTSNCGIILQT